MLAHIFFLRILFLYFSFGIKTNWNVFNTDSIQAHTQYNDGNGWKLGEKRAKMRVQYTHR